MNDRPSASQSGKWKVASRDFCFLLCTFCFLLPAGGQNLIKNGDFEEPLGPDNWTVVYAAVTGSPAQYPPTSCGPEDFMVQDRTTMGHKDRVFGIWDGNYSGGHFRPNSDWLMHAYFKQTVTNLIPGSNYIVTAWMAQTELIEKVQVYLEAMGGPAGALSRTSPSIYTNVWKSYSVTNSASTSGQIEVRLHFNRDEFASGQKWRNIDAFYDHVSVLISTQTPPIIVTQPYATNVCLGDTATFTVVANSGAPMSYQWFYNTYTRITGATNATLTITNIQTTNAGYYSVDVSNGYEVTSSNALLRVGTTITQQPAAQNVCPGSNATFSVSALGVGALSYQWQTNGVNLGNVGHYSGATTATLAVTGADTNDVLSYRCIVTSTCGSVTSSVVGLALSGTAITQQPSSNTSGVGCTASFTVAASSCGQVSYRWQKNNVDLSNGGHYSGCTTTTLTITGADSNDQADYRCSVSDPYVTNYSSSATLTVRTDCAPCGLVNGDFEGGNTGGVATGWTAYEVDSPSTKVWSIQIASPPEGLNYQQIQAYNAAHTASAGVRQDVTGCTIGATYQIAGWYRSNSDSGRARVRVSPTASTDWDTATNLNPVADYGSSANWATFSGTVVATGPSMTLWLDGRTIIGTSAKVGCFDAVTVTCAAAPPPPSITQQPGATNLCPGGTATFTVTATGSGTLTYQWQRNQDDLSDGGHYSGATTPALTVANASSGDEANYRCVVTYGGSSTNSTEAVLTLKAATAITQEPSATNVSLAANATFTVTATGDGALTYQWQTNGVNLSNGSHYGGCTTATLTVTNAGNADAVNYRCVVTGGCGSVTSSNVALALLAGTIYGKVQLQGYTGTGPRTVQFVASDGAGVGLQTTNVSLSFAGSPKVADYVLNVPTNTAWLSVKTVWNLRRRQAVTFLSGVATNDFSGAAGQLLGGDISQDNNLVNTADYTVLKGNWLKNTASADLTGDGLVNTTDYTILKGNWLKTGDPQ